jgi:potassium/hydrogen antiporter
VLALFPLLYGADHARLYFNVAFFIVLISLLLQGWTIAPVARWLRLEVPPTTEPLQRVTLDIPGHFEHEILCYEVKPRSAIAGRAYGELELPADKQVMAVMRAGVPELLRPELQFRAGDFVYVLARPTSLARLSMLFDPHVEPDRLEEHRYFGDFVLNGDAVAGELAAVYGFAIPEGAADQTLARYLDESFRGRVVVGDRVALGSAELVVREIEDGRITRVGLRLR